MRGTNSKDTLLVVKYVPTILRNIKEIGDVLGVGPKTVKAWVKQGAPIAVEGEGAKRRYSAELLRLQMWREGQQNNSSGQAEGLCRMDF